MFLDIRAEVRFGCAVGLFFLVFVISSWTSGSYLIYPCLGMLCCIETTVFRFRAVSCSSYIVSVFQCPSSNDHELDYFLPANKSSRTSVCAPSKVSGSALVKINQMRLTIWLHQGYIGFHAEIDGLSTTSPQFRILIFGS